MINIFNILTACMCTIVQERTYHFLLTPHYSVKLKGVKVRKVCIVLYKSVLTTFSLDSKTKEKKRERLKEFFHTIKKEYI